MRIALVMPGHDYSTQDVYNGLAYGLRALGHAVIEYDTGIRCDMANLALHELWRQGRRSDKPSLASTLYEGGRALYADLVEQAADAVVIVCSLMWHPQHTRNLKKAGVTVGIVHTEAPYMDALLAENLAEANVVWVNERTSVERLKDYWSWRDSRPRIHYLPHGYHPERHNTRPWPEADEQPAHDVVFVGTGFKERIALLEAIDWTGINLGLYGHWGLLRAPRGLRISPKRPEFPDRVRLAILRRLAASGAPGVSPLWQFYREGVIPNTRAALLYRRAAINLNLFRGSEKFRADSVQIPGGESANIRCYELAAMGAFFLTDNRPELADLFGGAVPTFDTPEQAAQLIRHYLGRPDEREQVVREVLQSIEPHSYVTRAAQVVAELRAAMIGNGSAGATGAPLHQEAVTP